jgi:tetratricopeptide (TPR) repeat protein
MTDANELYSQGNALRSQNKYQEAIEAYDKALALNASFAEALYDKGLALHNLNKFQEAIECYDKAIASKQNYLDAINYKGVVSFKSNVYYNFSKIKNYLR